MMQTYEQVMNELQTLDGQWDLLWVAITRWVLLTPADALWAIWVLVTFEVCGSSSFSRKTEHYSCIDGGMHSRSQYKC